MNVTNQLSTDQQHHDTIYRSMQLSLQPGFDLPWQQWSLLNRFRTEQGHCSVCRRKWRLTDTDLSLWRDPDDIPYCRILSRQNRMAAYLGYTLRMKTLFHGRPVMVHDMHTRIRRSYRYQYFYSTDRNCILFSNF